MYVCMYVCTCMDVYVCVGRDGCETPMAIVKSFKTNVVQRPSCFIRQRVFRPLTQRTFPRVVIYVSVSAIKNLVEFLHRLRS